METNSFDMKKYYENYSALNDEIFLGKEIVALPQKYSENEYYYAKETIEFVKYCTQYQKDCSVTIAEQNDIEVRSLHSFDIWLPIVWVASNVLLPFAINMVSNYISEQKKGREDEKAQVEVSFVVITAEGEKVLNYKGDADTFKETFEKIDINEL